MCWRRACRPTGPQTHRPSTCLPCTKWSSPQGRWPPPQDDENGDINLFGSDKEDEKEATKQQEEWVWRYAEKKAKKPALVAKSSILLGVKGMVRQT